MHTCTLQSLLIRVTAPPSTHEKRRLKTRYVCMCLCQQQQHLLLNHAHMYSTTLSCSVPFMHVQMSLYDILPLRDSVKASFEYDYAHFYYSVDDSTTHFSGHDEPTSNATGFGPRALKEKYKWTNSEAVEKSDQAMDVGGSKMDEKEAMVTKAKQLEELIARRKKALEVMEERKKIEEKMQRIQQAQKEENDFLKQCEDEMNAAT